MNIQDAQSDLRRAYWGGGPGVLLSGLVWLAAGVGAVAHTHLTSVLIFFFGGMLIHPLGIAISKAVKRSGKHQSDNPLATLAIENTVVLFMGLFLAYILFQVDPRWFYPTMLVIIGARYAQFQTLYGMRVYWILGAALLFAGIAIFILTVPFYIGAFTGGIIELIGALAIFRMEPPISKAKEDSSIP